LCSTSWTIGAGARTDAFCSAIGIGEQSPARPSHTPVLAGPHTAVQRVEPSRALGSIRRSPQGLRRSAGFRFGFTVFWTCKTQPKLIGWRPATFESDVLLLALTVRAVLTSVSPTPAADFCCRIKVNYLTLRVESETCSGVPVIRSTAFDTRPPDLPPAFLMDTEFAISCSLVRRRRPRIRFLSIGAYLCSTFPSDPTSR
jgi:hypothetical protein